MSDTTPIVKIDALDIHMILHKAVAEALTGSTIIAGKLLRTQLSQQGRGKIRRVSLGYSGEKTLRSKGYHQSSAAGQSPAPNTNRLRASWAIGTNEYKAEDGIFRIKAFAGTTLVELGSKVFYAKLLEYGTGKMKPRPYLSVVLPIIAKQLPAIFAVSIRKAFKNR